MHEENLTESIVDTSEEKTDFSGNYIDKFEHKAENEHVPGRIVDWEKVGDKFLFHAERASLEVTVISADIFKFRYANSGIFENDFSYAIDSEYSFEKEEHFFSETKVNFIIRTSRIKCYIKKENLKTKITDLKDHVILKDEKGYHWEEEKKHGGNIVFTTQEMHKDECFFGLGDKSGHLNLRGTRSELWGTDCYGYGADTDPVYKNIPFYMGLQNNVGYGVFFDNTFRSFFDFGYERKNVSSFWAQGGEMRYYFIAGPSLINVVERYAMLTGRPKLPPKWSLGYHQSKWSYYPESVVRDLANQFREKRIPCDVIHLDIDYMDGFRCFTWDKKRFPDPEKMMRDLSDQGFKSVVIIDPGIKVDKDYFVYKQGVENGYFCTRPDGPLLKGSVWPGECHFPDFTSKRVRKWWANLYEGLIEDGVAGVWNDMNEPAVFEEGTFPFDVRHDFDGHPCSHRKAHNIYGSLMAQATYEGQKKFLKNKRPFTITRSAYAGVQRFASVWTGDNVASWEHLKIANKQCQRLNLSGISFAGSDVGGFIGSPNAELYTRWIQMAVFHPFFRTHSSGDHGDKEPWIFGDETTDIVRKFIEMRYELLPYIYSTFWQNVERGTPMLRSLVLFAQDDPESFYRQEEFCLGDNIMLCPISKEGVDGRRVYFPKGEWYNFWTDELIIGGGEMFAKVALDELPMFVKSGAVIPMQPAMQYVDEFDFDQFTLHVYNTNEQNTSELYEDAGEGNEYASGACSLKKFTSDRSENKFELTQSIDGDFETNYSVYKVILHGFDSTINSINVDGTEFKEKISQNDNVISLIIPKDFEKFVIS